jgi:hypothetical protein
VSSNQSKNELKVLVLIDLAAICEKVADHPSTPEELRVKALGFVSRFKSLVAVRGKGDPAEHAEGEMLLIQISRFLGLIADIASRPESGQEVTAAR